MIRTANAVALGMVIAALYGVVAVIAARWGAKKVLHMIDAKQIVMEAEHARARG
jgi:hypothetical protein